MPKDARATSSTTINSLQDPQNEKLQTVAVIIRRSLHQAGVSLFEAGVALKEAKKMVGHGQFGHWLEKEVVCSVRTAQNLMRLATTFEGKYEELAYLPQKTLLSLASPSTPNDLRDEVTKEIMDGSRPTSSCVEDRIRSARLRESTSLVDDTSDSTPPLKRIEKDNAPQLGSSSDKGTAETPASAYPRENPKLTAELQRSLPPIIRSIKERDAACERLVAFTIHRIRKTEITAYIQDLRTMGHTRFADALSKADAERVEGEFRKNQLTWLECADPNESLN